MNTKILDQLEFNKVKDQFTEYLQTEQAQAELRDLVPMTNSERIQNQFTEIQEMAEIFVEHHGFAIGSLRDISEPLRRLELDADLSIQELIAIKKVLQASADLGRFYADLKMLSSSLSNVFSKRLKPSQVYKVAFKVSMTVVSLSILLALSCRISVVNSKYCDDAIRQTLQDILKKSGHMLAESLIASRNGRSVLPVKNTYRNRIAGVVHDISSSGNTVYIEPRAVIQLNEEITQLRADERHEMARILHELSDQLRPQAAAIANNAWILGHMDFIRGKYLYLQDKKAVIPKISDNQTLQLLNVRHPLLVNPVANDLRFDEDLTAIVITGPNTGGKTVMLKTLGLAQLMAQSGLPILADKGSRVAIFQEIFADIGDEQSIEQSLSTFSSHMTHIVEILDAADSNSLVLVDELGAGTDPQEGASLAMAILEHLRLSQIKTMATTHYPELKAYGIETQHVENASMEFDTATLSPTYRFMQGVPGRSNAFEIARRLGLNEIIVKEAENLTDTDSDVNRIIEQLEAQTVETQKRLEHIKNVEQENLKFNRAVKKLYNEFSHEYDKELEKAQKEIQEMVDTALAESDSILKNLHDKSQLKPHEVIDAKGKLKKLAPQVDLSKNKVLRKAKKEKAARAPRVGDDISSLPPMVNVVRLPVKPKMVTGKPR